VSVATAVVMGAPPREEQTRTVSLLGQRLRVRVSRGDGTRPPLLLMNGFGCSIEILEPFVQQLDPASGVISFDAPGIGGSRRTRIPYRLAGLSFLLGRLLEKLDVREVDVLGISWGGALAQQFALQNPCRCRRLVLVSTGPAPFVKPNMTTAREIVRPRRMDPRYTALAAAIYGGKVREDPSLLRLMRRRMPNAPGSELFQQLALAGWTSVPFLPLIRQPTLILAGDDDNMVPMVGSRLMNRLIPHSRLHVFHDGHLGLVTSAEELAPVIEEFLDAATP
jgi:poly(3-hydroxyalkanoate) depolymerase